MSKSRSSMLHSKSIIWAIVVAFSLVLIVFFTPGQAQAEIKPWQLRGLRSALNDTNQETQHHAIKKLISLLVEKNNTLDEEQRLMFAQTITEWGEHLNLPEDEEKASTVAQALGLLQASEASLLIRWLLDTSCPASVQYFGIWALSKPTSSISDFEIKKLEEIMFRLLYSENSIENFDPSSGAGALIPTPWPGLERDGVLIQRSAAYGLGKIAVSGDVGDKLTALLKVRGVKNDGISDEEYEDYTAEKIRALYAAWAIGLMLQRPRANLKPKDRMVLDLEDLLHKFIKEVSPLGGGLEAALVSSSMGALQEAVIHHGVDAQRLIKALEAILLLNIEALSLKAVRVMGRLASKSTHLTQEQLTSIVGLLIAMMHNDGVLPHAVEALRAARDAALPVLFRIATSHKDPLAQIRARWALCVLGQDESDALIAMLRPNEQPAVRLEAALALGLLRKLLKPDQLSHIVLVLSGFLHEHPKQDSKTINKKYKRDKRSDPLIANNYYIYYGYYPRYVILRALSEIIIDMPSKSIPEGLAEDLISTLIPFLTSKDIFNNEPIVSFYALKAVAQLGIYINPQMTNAIDLIIVIVNTRKLAKTGTIPLDRSRISVLLGNIWPRHSRRPIITPEQHRLNLVAALGLFGEHINRRDAVLAAEVLIYDLLSREFYSYLEDPNSYPEVKILVALGQYPEVKSKVYSALDEILQRASFQIDERPQVEFLSVLFTVLAQLGESQQPKFTKILEAFLSLFPLDYQRFRLFMMNIINNFDMHNKNIIRDKILMSFLYTDPRDITDEMTIFTDETTTFIAGSERLPTNNSDSMAAFVGALAHLEPAQYERCRPVIVRELPSLIRSVYETSDPDTLYNLYRTLMWLDFDITPNNVGYLFLISHKLEVHASRFLIHYYGGTDDAGHFSALLSRLVKPNPMRTTSVSPKEALLAPIPKEDLDFLEAVDARWASLTSPTVYNELLLSLRTVIVSSHKEARSVGGQLLWLDELERLRAIQLHLEQTNFTGKAKDSSHELARDIGTVIAESKEPILPTIIALGLIILCVFPLAWGLVLGLYPRKRWVQSWVWDTSKPLLGFRWLVLSLPSALFPAHWLFEPYKRELVRDAPSRVGEGYYDKLQVSYYDSALKREVSASLEGTIPQVQGHILLEGESGLGKTTHLTTLIATDRSLRPVVYLRAESCVQGIKGMARTISTMLPEFNLERKSNLDFLERLIKNGAMDICIDGLNEVNPTTRGTIINLVEHQLRGNVILTTQPLGWVPPDSFRSIKVIPIELSQVFEFLLTQRYVYKKDIKINNIDYINACTDFAARLPHQLADSTAQDYRLIFSNPMDLTIVAQMLASARQPDLINLQQQQYDLMASDFLINNGIQFPLESVAKEAYQMRLEGRRAFNLSSLASSMLDGESVPSGLVRESMLKHKLFVASGHLNSTNYVFRHDKIWDFFIAEALLGFSEYDKIEEHIQDPRFRGVFASTLMSSELSPEDQLWLRERLLQQSLISNDLSTFRRCEELRSMAELICALRARESLTEQSRATTLDSLQALRPEQFIYLAAIAGVPRSALKGSSQLEKAESLYDTLGSTLNPETFPAEIQSLIRTARQASRRIPQAQTREPYQQLLSQSQNRQQILDSILHLNEAEFQHLLSRLNLCRGMLPTGSQVEKAVAVLEEFDMDEFHKLEESVQKILNLINNNSKTKIFDMISR